MERGPRTMADSTGSVSEPPPAAAGFKTLSTDGIVVRSVVICPAATLPREPPPAR
jgi:hypothetical protein